MRLAEGFYTSPVPYLVSDSRLRISDVNAAFEQRTHQRRCLIVGERLFDVFPENSANPGADGVERISASLESVLRSGRPHWMGVQHYDLPDIDRPGEFVHKVWAPVYSPIIREGRPVAVLHRAEDVTAIADWDARDPLHIRAAAHRLSLEFLDLPVEAVVALLMHSHEVVLRLLGHPNGQRAEALARMRLELVAGHPGGSQPEPPLPISSRATG